MSVERLYFTPVIWHYDCKLQPVTGRLTAVPHYRGLAVVSKPYIIIYFSTPLPVVPAPHHHPVRRAAL